MQELLSILFVLLIMSWAAGLILHYAFLSRLRTHHAETWEALGRPTLLLNNSMLNSFAVLRFLWQREYRELADARSVRLATFLRSFLAAYFLLFALVVAVLITWAGTD